MKRRLLIIAIFLLAGAVVNVAVAWGCGEWSYILSRTTPIQDRIFEARVIPARRAPPDWPRPKYKVYASGFGLTYGSLRVVSHREKTLYVKRIRQVGLPFRCLESETHGWLQNPGGSFSIYMRIIPRPIDPDNGLFLIRPIWPGFAVNTLFYGVILWLLARGPFALRRFLRVRRGLCPRCAYPMGESAVCTECGCELAKRARTT